MRKKASAAVIGLAIAGVSVLATTSASSHGYTDSPISRQKLCANGTVTGCGNIQWEPQSVEGPKGFPAAGPADGKICSGGNGQFAQLDDPRGGNWPATQVTGGQGYSFRWQFTARHSTSDFRYYITKNGWDSTKPLTRAALESQPFMTVPYGNRQPCGHADPPGHDPHPEERQAHHPRRVERRGHHQRVLRLLRR